MLVWSVEPEVHHGKDADLNLPTKHHRFIGCSEMDLALFQNHAVVLNYLPHQVPVRDLKTSASSKAGHQIQNAVSQYILHSQTAFTGSRDGTDCFAVTF